MPRCHPSVHKEDSIAITLHVDSNSHPMLKVLICAYLLAVVIDASNPERQRPQAGMPLAVPPGYRLGMVRDRISPHRWSLAMTLITGEEAEPIPLTWEQIQAMNLGALDEPSQGKQPVGDDDHEGFPTDPRSSQSTSSSRSSMQVSNYQSTSTTSDQLPFHSNSSHSSSGIHALGVVQTGSNVDQGSAKDSSTSSGYNHGTSSSVQVVSIRAVFNSSRVGLPSTRRILKQVSLALTFRATTPLPIPAIITILSLIVSQISMIRNIRSRLNHNIVLQSGRLAHPPSYLWWEWDHSIDQKR